MKLCHAEGGSASTPGWPTRAASRSGSLTRGQGPCRRAARVLAAGGAAARRRRAARAPRRAGARGRGGAGAPRPGGARFSERRPATSASAGPRPRRAAPPELAPRTLSLRLLAARLDETATGGGRSSRPRWPRTRATRLRSPRWRPAIRAAAQPAGAGARPARARGAAGAPGFVTAGSPWPSCTSRLGLAARARTSGPAPRPPIPSTRRAVAAAARGARLQDRLDEAARLLRKALALRFDDAAARATLVQVLLDAADLEGAVRLLGETLRLEPADSRPATPGGPLAANARWDDAENAYAAALAITPEEPEILERRGQARLRGGHGQEALADFQAALELKPQNAQLKELVRAIEPTRERFETPYLRDARALARTAPAPEQDEDALILSDLKVTKVFLSGLASSFRQLVVKVQTPARRRCLAQLGHRLHARPPGGAGRAGAHRQARRQRDRHLPGERPELLEPWYRLYYDTRTRQLGFPSLAPGDVLELRYRIDDVAQREPPRRLLRRGGSSGTTPAAPTPSTSCSCPRGAASTPADPALPRLREEREGAPGASSSGAGAPGTWRGSAPEPGMPGWSEVAPYVHVSTYASWEEVGRFYWGARPRAARRDARDRGGRAPPRRRGARGAARRGSCRKRATSWRSSRPPTASSSRTRATSRSSSASTASSRTGWSRSSRAASATARTRRASPTPSSPRSGWSRASSSSG